MLLIYQSFSGALALVLLETHTFIETVSRPIIHALVTADSPLQKKRKLPNRLPDLLNHCAGASVLSLPRSPIYYSLLFALEAASTSTIWFLVQPNPSCHHHHHHHHRRLLVPLEHQSLSFSRVVGVVGITTTAHTTSSVQIVACRPLLPSPPSSALH